jgi:hypothetical protein
MNRESLEELKTELRQLSYKVGSPQQRVMLKVAHGIERLGLEWEFAERVIVGHTRIEAADRVAVGSKWRGPDDFSLVLRLQGNAPREVELVNEFAHRVGHDEVDLAIVEKLRINTNSTCFGARTIRPLELGYSIGHERGEAGTLGAFAEHANGTGVVSGNHVLGLMNAANIGDPIIQPGPNDSAGSDRIGALGKMELLQFYPRSRNRVDAALAVLDQGVGHCGNILPVRSGARDGGRPLVGVVGDVYDLVNLHGHLAKIGRTTGYNSVPLSQVSIGMDNVEVYFGATPVRFDGLIEIEWHGRGRFTDDGDSGCLYYIEGERYAVGLHIGGGSLIRNGRRTQVSYGCVLSEALARLEARLLT